MRVQRKSDGVIFEAIKPEVSTCVFQQGHPVWVEPTCWIITTVPVEGATPVESKPGGVFVAAPSVRNFERDYTPIEEQQPVATEAPEASNTEVAETHADPETVESTETPAAGNSSKKSRK